MNRHMTMLACLSTTASLLLVNPAFARGGGGGGHSHGHSHGTSLSRMSSISHPGFAFRSKPSQPSFTAHKVSRKSGSHENERRDRHDDRHKTISEHKHSHATERRSAEPKQRTQPEVKKIVTATVRTKTATKPVMLAKQAARIHQLTDRHFATAKLSDGKGRHYDAQKKSWTDGKGRWWHGRFAWLYIDGAWYYGNSRWTASGTDWSCVDEVAPACPNHGPARLTQSATGAASPVAQPALQGDKHVAPTTVAMVTPSAAKPATPGKPMETDQPAVLVKQAKQAPQSQQTAGTEVQKQTASVPVITPDLPGIETASPDRQAGSGQQQTSSVSPAATVECKRYLPNLSLTITVPCAP